MTVRTTKKAVTFVNPFTLGDFNEVFPPGTYDVETDEERLEGLSFQAYRRTLTLLHVPENLNQPGLSRILTINPDDLDRALKRDLESNTVIARPEPYQKSDKELLSSQDSVFDRHAIDRADDEGMLRRPR